MVCPSQSESVLAKAHAWLFAPQDDRINRAEVLFPGVACFLIAALVGLLVHASNTDDINAKLGTKRGHWLSNVTAKEAHETPAPKGTLFQRYACMSLQHLLCM